MKREIGNGENRKMEMEWKWVGWRSIILIASLKIWAVFIGWIGPRTWVALLDIACRRERSVGDVERPGGIVLVSMNFFGESKSFMLKISTSESVACLLIFHD